MTRFQPTRRTMTLLMLSAAIAPISTTAIAQAKPVVASVNYPLAYFAERLVGDSADVLFPVPANIDPSFWRPGIADISAMQAADIIAFNGAGFATWTTKVSLSRARIVDTSAGFADRFISTETITHSHGDGGAHSHTGVANYVWLDFTLAMLQADALAARIIRMMPDAKDRITQNLDALKSDLAALDTSAKEIAGLAAEVTAISSHPRYEYFGRAYGINMSAMDWDANEEVRAEQWQTLADRITTTGATLFIWEAVPSPEARAKIKDMGLTDVVFPPLANRPKSGDFLSEMTKSIEEIKAALST